MMQSVKLLRSVNALGRAMHSNGTKYLISQLSKTDDFVQIMKHIENNDVENFELELNRVDHSTNQRMHLNNILNTRITRFELDIAKHVK
jgi:hypothetical protein